MGSIAGLKKRNLTNVTSPRGQITLLASTGEIHNMAINDQKRDFPWGWGIPRRTTTNRAHNLLREKGGFAQLGGLAGEEESSCHRAKASRSPF
jgi:hypothetical protein